MLFFSFLLRKFTNIIKIQQIKYDFGWKYKNLWTWLYIIYSTPKYFFRHSNIWTLHWNANSWHSIIQPIDPSLWFLHSCGINFISRRKFYSLNKILNHTFEIGYDCFVLRFMTFEEWQCIRNLRHVNPYIVLFALHHKWKMRRKFSYKLLYWNTGLWIIS